jgi:hypothetical protein
VTKTQIAAPVRKAVSDEPADQIAGRKKHPMARTLSSFSTVYAGRETSRRYSIDS